MCFAISIQTFPCFSEIDFGGMVTLPPGSSCSPNKFEQYIYIYMYICRVHIFKCVRFESISSFIRALRVSQ